MGFTTDESPIKEKLGIPEGEAKINKVSASLEKQQNNERMHDNSPTINEAHLKNTDKSYIINSNKNPTRTDREEQ